ncbi:MAG: prepilin-type N-terminal cleavage/methylation domain-containing protein [Clostridiales Family XIII bacterium]|jgi:type IV pilus assembly protein PilA|nr:prepilin-type N-terminal cleavage/methylation domain-containing protein [Clostridiales Family XIII bacterium]
MYTRFFRRIGRFKSLGKRDGFTLVEVIVVLVILAILAAVAVPALTGYIDKARSKSVVADAHTATVAIQTWALEQYAVGITGEDLAAAAGVESATMKTDDLRSEIAIDRAEVVSESKVTIGTADLVADKKDAKSFADAEELSYDLHVNALVYQSGYTSSDGAMFAIFTLDNGSSSYAPSDVTIITWLGGKYTGSSSSWQWDSRKGSTGLWYVTIVLDATEYQNNGNMMLQFMAAQTSDAAWFIENDANLAGKNGWDGVGHVTFDTTVPTLSKLLIDKNQALPGVWGFPASGGSDGTGTGASLDVDSLTWKQIVDLYAGTHWASDDTITISDVAFNDSNQLTYFVITVGENVCTYDNGVYTETTAEES